MEAIDALLAKCEELSSRFAGPMGQAERIATAERLLANWSDAIANLKRLTEMCDNYLLKKYTEVVTKQYDASQYEEP
jgi:hypothetical protein